MAATVRQYVQLLRHLGPVWLGFRAYYAATQHMGMARLKSPPCDWEQEPLHASLTDPTIAEPTRYAAYRHSTSPPFLFHWDQRPAFQPLFDQWDEGLRHPQRVTDDLARGVLHYFEYLPVKAGFPPRWNDNCLTGKTLPTNLHWSQINDFSSGDIKLVWEPNRFAFTYALVRMYWRTGDDSFAETFWQLVEDWRKHNPPQRGPNWKCGQEVALRLMAWCFGLYGFMASPATTPERLAILAQMVAVSGRRIRANLQYGASQKNNHGISEAMGLWTIGLLFPELREAKRWRRVGRNLLERIARELIYEDGSFSQHSLNYHRLALHDYVWSLRLGELHGERFSDELYDRVDRAGNLLLQLQDRATGYVPSYGQNDSALVLPTNNCDPRDFRPIIQATAQLARRSREYDHGPWDEDLVWLFGPQALQAPHKPTPQSDMSARVGGYYTLRSSKGFAFVRAARFRHRPSQADCLHTDIWWRGQNIAIDPGTYSYNAPAPWNNPFARTEFHNTITVDGLDQMDRPSRFLWLPWLTGQVTKTQTSLEGWLSYWEGAHNGYHRLSDPVSHRRGVLRLGEEHWLVLDHVSASMPHRFRLHWLFPSVPHTYDADTRCLVLNTKAGEYRAVVNSSVPPERVSVVEADEQGPRGWRARSYMDKEPAVSLAVEVHATTASFWTLLGPASAGLEANRDQVQVQTPSWHANMILRQLPKRDQTLIDTVSLRGTVAHLLEFS